MLVSVAEAVRLLRRDEVVGLPTETVYGLGARLGSELGIQKIFTTKKRPFFDPLIVHVRGTDQARNLTKTWPPLAEVLAQAFWPGPLSLVLPKRDSVSDLVTSGLSSVALRCPASPLFLEILEELGEPIPAPSANLFGRTSPTTAQGVLEELGEQGVSVVDGGSCSVGIESTILKIEEDDNGFQVVEILREGKIQHSDIQSVADKAALRLKWVQLAKGKLEAPGQMKHHYMPGKPFGLVAPSLSVEEIVHRLKKESLGWPQTHEGVDLPRLTGTETVELKLSTNAEIAAREFYGRLREVAKGPEDIIILRFQDHMNDPSWLPLRDRMTKAAIFDYRF